MAGRRPRLSKTPGQDQPLSHRKRLPFDPLAQRGLHHDPETVSELLDRGELITGPL